MKVPVVAAGGLYDGRGLAACLALGAAGVWIGTRFLATHESNIEQGYKDLLVQSSSEDTVKTLYYTGRPMRVIKNQLLAGAAAKESEVKKMLESGKIPFHDDIQSGRVPLEVVKNMDPDEPHDRTVGKFFRDFEAALAGQGLGGIREIKPAAQILQEMVDEAIKVIKQNNSLLRAKL